MPPRTRKTTTRKATAKKAATTPRKTATPKPPADAAEQIADLAPPPEPSGSRASKSFVSKAGSVADDVAAFVADSRKKLDKLTEAHGEATAAHTGATGHEAVAFELRRVGSTLADVDLALATASSAAGRLAGESATVGG
jgi:hypothetical protein